MATNPNVPANQAEAAKSSAPDAKVIGTQPAQQSAATPTNGGAAQVASSVPNAAPAAAVPVDSTKAVAPSAKSDAQAASDLKADRAEEQKTLKELNKKNEGADYFEKVANDDEVFHDVFREQARLEREAEAAAHRGDPTRDPVAKQAAMDMNTPMPGAQEEAAKMRK